MRSAALCLLAVAAPGCNWVFGLEPTILVDAAPDVVIDAALPTAKLTWLVAVTDTTTGLPVTLPEIAPIAPAPTVKIGRIDGALTDAVYGADGSIQLPYEYDGTAWRLVYQLANDIPREVHWTPAAGATPHATVPLFGRVARAPSPGPNAAYQLTPTGSPTYNLPRVYTTGVWSEARSGVTPPVNLNVANLVQVSDPPGVPEGTKKDLVVLVDFQNSPASCFRATGSAGFYVTLINGASPSTPSGTTLETWAFSSESKTINTPISPVIRVALAQDSANPDTNAVATHVTLGRAPTTALPAFTQKPQLGTALLPRPMMLSLLDCATLPYSALTLPGFGNPGALVNFPLLAFQELTSQRDTPSGATLVTGLSAVGPSIGGVITPDFSVAIPQAPYMLGGTDVGTTDRIQLPAGTGPLVLSFAMDAEPGARADYHEVVLHEVVGVSLRPQRAYTVAGRSVSIDRAVLTSGTEYVFEIRAYRGSPDAQAANFTRYESVQSQAVVHTHTFRAP